MTPPTTTQQPPQPQPTPSLASKPKPASVQISERSWQAARQVQRRLNSARREDQPDLTLNDVLSMAILLGLSQAEANLSQQSDDRDNS